MRAADIKIRISAFIFVVGLCLGVALTLLLWLGAPARLYETLRWIGCAGVAILGAHLIARASRQRVVTLLAAAAAISVIYLFPQLLGPGCGGMPRAFALDDDCRFKCTKWSPCPDGHCCDDGKIVCTVEDDPPPLAPPSISASLNCTRWGERGWCVGDETLELSASDPQGQTVLISGDVAGNIFACPEGNATCSVPLPAGSGAIHYKVTSATALTDSGSTTWSLDNDTPAINGTLNGSSGTNGWFISKARVSASADDPTSGVAGLEYSFDEINWTAYSAPIEISDGTYTIHFRATDNAGNRNEVAQALQVDTITPQINLSISGTQGAGGWYVSDVQVNASALDLTAGLASFEYSLNDGAWTPYTSVLPYSEGRYNLKFRAVDQAGNTSVTPAQILWVDKTPPEIAMRSAWNLGSTENYKVTDNGSGVSGVRVVIQDGGERYPKVAWEDGDVGTSFAGDIFWDGRFADGAIAPEGDYYVTLKAYDVAGNESRQTATITVQSSLFTHLIPQVPHPTQGAAQIPIPSPSSNGTNFGGGSNDNSSSAQTNSVSTGGALTNAAGIQGSTSFGVSLATTSQRTNTQSSGILWGAAAAAAIGAFTAEALRRKAEREAEQRRRKVYSDEGGGMSYRQIAKAYQASLTSFKAKLMGQGLSETQANALRDQAIANGSISSVEDIADTTTAQTHAQVHQKESEMKNQSSPPPPLTTRALTIVPALIGFAVLDLTLVSITIANTVAIGLAPDPLSKAVFVSSEIVVAGADILVAYLHISYAHWVTTGHGIHSWNDLTDWKIRP